MLSAVRETIEATGAQIVQERLFGDLAALPVWLGMRERVLGPWLSECVPWPCHAIEGEALDGAPFAGVHIAAIAGEPCRALLDQGAPVGVVVEGESLTRHYLGGIAGGPAGGEPGAQATAMFELGQRLLADEGVAWDRVARTWLYLNRILEWYGALNDSRTAAYTGWGVGGPGGTPLPASTGIMGRIDEAIACSMDVLAITGPGRTAETVVQMHNPAQNEAYSYGSAFSRGMLVSDGGLATAYISGTASIDEAGLSIHDGDALAQTECTLDKIEALLGTAEMTLDDIVTSTIFVKRREDASAVLPACAARSSRLAAGTAVLADVCRDELLVEIEVTAARCR